MASPAMNAPSASESPAMAVSQAVPKPTRMMVRMNSSRLRADYMVEYPGNQQARHSMHLVSPQRPWHRPTICQLAPCCAGQQRRCQHHRHNAQILEDQDAEGGLAVRSVQLSRVHQQFHQDGGTGKGHNETEEQPPIGVL